jgi:homoserine dehydrogenase
MVPRKTELGVVIVGVGTVGSELVNELLGNDFFKKHGIDLLMLCNSKKVVLTPLNNDWRRQLEGGEQFSLEDLDRILEGLRVSAKHLVVVDCTADGQVGRLYSKLLKGSISVVTANKKGLAGPLDEYKMLPINQVGLPQLGFESTVGAGLPIIKTIRSIQGSGDTIEHLEGILSGTLAYLFNNFMPTDGSPGRDFITILEEAKSKGYTEPDPLEDLRGMDVARKTCILGRLLGNQVESPEAIVNSLFTVEDAEDLDRLNSHLSEMKQKCKNDGTYLRYVARISSKTLKVGVVALPITSPLLSAKGCDNVVTITTSRFPNGITIQGAGAGPSATIHGILSDMTDIYHRLL